MSTTASSSTETAPTPEIDAEQATLDELLSVVDEARERLTDRLRRVQRRSADIDQPQLLLERDHETASISQRIDEYSAAEIGLFFGRIDVEDTEPENPVVDDSPVATAARWTAATSDASVCTPTTTRCAPC